MRHAQQRDIVERDGAADALRPVRIERNEGCFQTVGRRSVWQRKARGRRFGAWALNEERCALRLPVGKLHRLAPHALQTEGAELVFGPVLRPAVRRVAGPADSLPEDALDPGVDLDFGRNALRVNGSGSLSGTQL
jgi:hypothetical protein